MNIYRYEENPLITPLDVKPIHEGFEVIGALTLVLPNITAKYFYFFVWQKNQSVRIQK